VAQAEARRSPARCRPDRHRAGRRWQPRVVRPGVVSVPIPARAAIPGSARLSQGAGWC